MSGLLVGDVVENFELPDDLGRLRRLSEFLSRGPVVVFFYPSALSPVCTGEGRRFRDLATRFGVVGAQRVGISRDPVERQARLARRYGFDFPLLSDPQGVVARRFGARRWLPLGPLGTRRMTFVIGTDWRVRDVVHSELGVQEHADRALRVLGG
ncbi:peroxiredoxin Q/BCP [Micromonospora nigra]|uniref:thioredoxin-dependent peroxiredoxin n=1 Tax=Micromonospora nigra TaxID=145857 RepID=A0A1C6T4F5_9ACTN|nr:peroxiredoxin [Micromonospora nigra]SCL36413.1 peroxiredoxin Q/BCP [Micromonospora nigra]